MDKWLVNMTAGATLSALLVIFGSNTLFDIVYPTGGGPEPEPEVVEASAPATQAPAAAEEEKSLPVLLASATVDGGQSEARKCAACHGFDEGGANKIGPNLYDIVGRQVASSEGFAYSNALIEFGGVWDYERLDKFLENPSEYIPGNKMSFAGIKRDSSRADMIIYLKSVSPGAPPLPEPTETAAVNPASEEGAETAVPVEAETGTQDASAGDQAVEPEAAPANEAESSAENSGENTPAASEIAEPEANTTEEAGDSSDGNAENTASDTGSGEAPQGGQPAQPEANADDGAGETEETTAENTAADDEIVQPDEASANGSTN